LRHFENIFSMI